MNTRTLTTIFFIGFISIINGQTDYTKLVNTFVGTGGHGHTFPGATRPFGMIQLSPDTGIEGWDWCSGYHSSDSSIMGFSHTHLSGTGVGDYGDILFMPFVGEDKFEPGTKQNPDEGYRSRFKHENEKAVPGYYSVFLDDYDINVELAAAKRSGFHKYNFNNSTNGKIIVDLGHGIQDAPIETFIKIIDKNTIEGYRTSSGWAKRHTVYFYAELSADITSHTIRSDNKYLTDNSGKGQIV
jgi:putative alpha-1,2-mannosidase